MRRLLSLKFLALISMAMLLMTAPQIQAMDDDDPLGLGGSEETESSGSSTPKEKEESIVIDELMERMCGNDEKLGKATLKKDNKKWIPILENPDKDPFRPIIEKEVVLPPVRQQPVQVKPQEKKPTAPPIKPIKLFVSGIVGNEGNRLAIVKFENEELTISKDQIVEGKFKVVDIYADRVVVYSNKEQRRHTFKIGGDEK